MDWTLRRARSGMILYEGGPVVMGQWVEVPDDRPWVPVPHVFGQRTWDAWPTHLVEPAVGEQRSTSRLARLKELPARLLGKHYCGSPEIWAGKATAADVGTPVVDWEGIPLCCEGPPAVGGIGYGGTPAAWLLYPFGPDGPGAGTSVQCTLSVPAGGAPVSSLPLVWRLDRDHPFELYQGLVIPPAGGAIHAAVVYLFGTLIAYQVWQDPDPQPVPSLVTYQGSTTLLDQLVSLPSISPDPLRLQIQEVGPPEGWPLRPVVCFDFELQNSRTKTINRLRGLDGYAGDVYLYTNGDMLLKHDLVPADFTEPTFGGYAPVTNIASSWVSTNDNGIWVATRSIAVEWIVTGPPYGELIGGWFIRTAVGDMSWAQPLQGGPIRVAGAGQRILVPIAVSLRSQYQE
jgi:hypothetical protein